MVTGRFGCAFDLFTHQPDLFRACPWVASARPLDDNAIRAYPHGKRVLFEAAQGSLLHSGIIPAGMNLSSDPRVGRLTANFFLRGH